eukprot:43121-Chlamydomonas_euryale.AAC.2
MSPGSGRQRWHDQRALLSEAGCQPFLLNPPLSAVMSTSDGVHIHVVPLSRLECLLGNQEWPAGKTPCSQPAAEWRQGGAQCRSEGHVCLVVPDRQPRGPIDSEEDKTKSRSRNSSGGPENQKRNEEMRPIVQVIMRISKKRKVTGVTKVVRRACSPAAYDRVYKQCTGHPFYTIKGNMLKGCFAEICLPVYGPTSINILGLPHGSSNKGKTCPCLYRLWVLQGLVSSTEQRTV